MSLTQMLFVLTLATLLIDVVTASVPKSQWSLEEKKLAYWNKYTAHKEKFLLDFDQTEDQRRFEIYVDTMEEVKRINSEDHPFKLGETEFTTLTLEEFRTNYQGYPGVKSKAPKVSHSDNLIQASAAVSTSKLSTMPSSPSTIKPTYTQTTVPTKSPTNYPSISPTKEPSFSPSKIPSSSPTVKPSSSPSITPTQSPTNSPSISPTKEPSFSPTRTPSSSPTIVPSKSPTNYPTTSPTKEPSFSPTKLPSSSPTVKPTISPSFPPTKSPTNYPSYPPTREPSFSPSRKPTSSPTTKPSPSPIASPTPVPSTLLPTFVDWNQTIPYVGYSGLVIPGGYVTIPQRQTSCGACWAFASVNTLESAYAIKYGILYTFSKQFVVSCATDCYYGTVGCEGGFPECVPSWVNTQGGLPLQSNYPYVQLTQVPQTNTAVCNLNLAKNKIPIKVKTVNYLTYGATFQQMKAVIYQQPVSALICGDQLIFKQYVSGILTLTDDVCCPNGVTHAVEAVGYGTDPVTGKNYIKVKNSWGTWYWGQLGFGLIDPGSCMINTGVTYPTLL